MQQGGGRGQGRVGGVAPAQHQPRPLVHGEGGGRGGEPGRGPHLQPVGGHTPALLYSAQLGLNTTLLLMGMFGLKNVQTWNHKTNLFGNKVIVLKCDEIIPEE